MSYPQFPQQPQQHARQFGEPPLWAPYYGASFPVAVKRFFKKYATFSGRASRSEYWWWELVVVGVYIVIGAVGAATTNASSLDPEATSPADTIGAILLGIWILATAVPSIALTVRRLHDVNIRGWLVLIGLVPILGGLVLLILTILPSNPAGQRFDQPS